MTLWIAAYMVLALLCAIGAFWPRNRFWRVNLAATGLALGMAAFHAIGAVAS